MSSPSGTKTRTRSEHVAQLELPPSRIHRTMALIRRGDVLARLAICVVAILTMWTLTAGWSVRMPYRTGMVPERDIITRQTFERENEEQTDEERERARRSIQCVYNHNVESLTALRGRLKDRLLQVINAESFESLDKKVFAEFMPQPSVNAGQAAPSKANSPNHEAIYDEMVTAFENDTTLESFDSSLEQLFEPLTQFGILESIEHELDEGSQTEISIRRVTDNHREYRVPIDRVRRSNVLAEFDKDIKSALPRSPVLQKHIGHWIKSQLPNTLSYNRQLTKEEADAAVANVETVRDIYEAGEERLAEAGKPLTAEKIELLRREHAAWLAARPWRDRVAKVIGDIGMYVALFSLCGAYLVYRRHEILSNFRMLVVLLGAVTLTVVSACFVARDGWQGELIPLMLFGITAALAYRQELALMISASICLVVVLTLQQGVVEFSILAACLAATILMLRRVRSRTKLIYVGLTAGAVTFLTTLGVRFGGGAPLDMALLVQATWYGFCAVLSGILMTGLLPFIERALDFQTDISLLELGDVSHPLLQELVRRAPGTYNHSINVASIAESAAESIGANGLLVRVGAYFHDIGKMLKPQYFIENQSDGNRHEALLPAMSTLIIIAHVKDGADLARQRQHRLPQAIIDFILQHHGTTLVEYFFSQANRQCEEDPDAGEVDEGSYRYPGPKPQTREAAVLMLADGVESASRSLQDPAPARIESLVNDIAMKKLMDGQFDECGITLKQLRTVQDSLIKSLTAMYHSRVKYPDQQTA